MKKSIFIMTMGLFALIGNSFSQIKLWNNGGIAVGDTTDPGTEKTVFYDDVEFKGDVTGIAFPDTLGGSKNLFDNGTSSYFTGNLGIGTTTPISLLDAKANNVPGVLTIRGGLNTVVAVGEINSAIDFGQNDASQPVANYIGARIANVTEYNNGGRAGLAFYTGNSDPLTERLRITYNGNVGIGTATPANNLHIHSSAVDRPYVRWTSTVTGTSSGTILGFANADGDFQIRNQLARNIQILTNEVARMTIAGSSGNVGIGTSNPQTVFDLRGTATTRVGLESFSSIDFIETDLNTTEFGETNAYGFRVGYDGSVNTLKIQSGNQTTVTDRLSILRDLGYVGIGTTTPAARLHVVETTTEQGIILSSSVTSADLLFKDDSDGDTFGWQFNRSSNQLRLNINSTHTHTFEQNGNVAIGNTSASYKLDVNGTFRAVGNSYFNANIFQGTNDIHYFGSSSNANIYHSGSHFYINNNTGLLYFQEGGVNRMSINTSGAVAIASPTAGSVTLSLGRSSGYPNIKSSDSYLFMDSNSGYVSLNHYVSDNVVLVNGGGNVGIGDSTPSYKLDVNGTGRFTGSLIAQTLSLSGTMTLTNGINVSGSSYFNNGLTAYQFLTIYGTFNNMSDLALKTDIQNLSAGSLSKITSLQGVTYKFIEDEERKTNTGFIAQDVQKVFPELVTELEEGLAIKTLDIIPHLVEAIKEQQQIIESLEARIKTLEAK